MGNPGKFSRPGQGEQRRRRPNGAAEINLNDQREEVAQLAVAGLGYNKDNTARAAYRKRHVVGPTPDDGKHTSLS